MYIPNLSEFKTGLSNSVLHLNICKKKNFNYFEHFKITIKLSIQFCCLNSSHLGTSEMMITIDIIYLDKFFALVLITFCSL